MPLDVARATSTTESLNGAFREIGYGPGTAMPHCRVKHEPAAWEYHVASHLLRIAETRRKRAHAAAVRAGVIFDHERAPEPVGTNRLVYSGPLVEIGVAVAAPIEGIDHAGFVADLLRAGVKPALVKRLTTKHTTETRPAHKFTSSLRTDAAGA